MKRALITGAAGFCGLHLSRYLVKKKLSVFGTYHACRPDSLPGVTYYPADITRFTQIESLVKKIKPDFIYHLAAMSVPRLSWKQEKETFDINVLGTVHLLEAVRRHAPHARVVFASSVQVYGRRFRKNRPVDESDLIWPESPYAVSKAIAEYVCIDYAGRFGLGIVIARAFNHLGAGQSLKFVFSDWCRQIALIEKKRKKPVLEVGNLDARRDFLHVQDVVKAYELLARRGKAGRIYNIAYGKTMLLKHYVDFLIRNSKTAVRVQIQKQRLRRNDPPIMSGKSNRLRALGWKPRMTPTQGLTELLNEWRAKT